MGRMWDCETRTQLEALTAHYMVGERRPLEISFWKDSRQKIQSQTFEGKCLGCYRVLNLVVHQNHIWSFLEVKLLGPNLTASLLFQIPGHLDWEPVSLPWLMRPTGSGLHPPFSLYLWVSKHFLSPSLCIIYVSTESCFLREPLISHHVTQRHPHSLVYFTLFYFPHSLPLSLKGYFVLLHLFIVHLRGLSGPPPFFKKIYLI